MSERKGMMKGKRGKGLSKSGSSAVSSAAAHGTGVALDSSGGKRRPSPMEHGKSPVRRRESPKKSAPPAPLLYRVSRSRQTPPFPFDDLLGDSSPHVSRPQRPQPPAPPTPVGSLTQGEVMSVLSTRLEQHLRDFIPSLVEETIQAMASRCASAPTAEVHGGDGRRSSGSAQQTAHGATPGVAPIGISSETPLSVTALNFLQKFLEEKHPELLPNVQAEAGRPPSGGSLTVPSRGRSTSFGNPPIPKMRPSHSRTPSCDVEIEVGDLSPEEFDAPPVKPKRPKVIHRTAHVAPAMNYQSYAGTASLPGRVNNNVPISVAGPLRNNMADTTERAPADRASGAASMSPSEAIRMVRPLRLPQGGWSPAVLRYSGTSTSGARSVSAPVAAESSSVKSAMVAIQDEETSMEEDTTSQTSVPGRSDTELSSDSELHTPVRTLQESVCIRSPRSAFYEPPSRRSSVSSRSSSCTSAPVTTPRVQSAPSSK